jgi:hypothetical protein
VPEGPAGKDKHMNYETMHATDLLKALEGRSYCAVAEELAHAEGAYDADIARARIQKAMDKGFLYIDDIDAYTLTALGLDYVDDFADFLEDQAAEAAAEAEVEFRSSWVAGGGRKEDAGLAWSMHRDAYNAGHIG